MEKPINEDQRAATTILLWILVKRMGGSVAISSDEWNAMQPLLPTIRLDMKRTPDMMMLLANTTTETQGGDDEGPRF